MNTGVHGRAGDQVSDRRAGVKRHASPLADNGTMTTITAPTPTAAAHHDTEPTTGGRWRPLFVAAGVLMAASGPLHPESDASGTTREELATMTAGDTWIVSHAGVAFGTLLLALGLWSAHRSGRWPIATRRTLRLAAIAVSVYVVETVMHLAAVIDKDALAAGDPAPIAFSHLALAAVLYPLSGVAIVALAVRLFGAVTAGNKVLAGIGVLAGIAHAVSVPLTLLAPDLETTPVFAAGGMLLAAWAIGTGIAGIRERRAAIA
jgi:hypothetical protein